MRDPKRTGAEQQRRGPREAPGGEPVRVWLLGGFRVSVGSRSIGEEQWRLKKAASLIKLLALAEGHRMHREQAAEVLWPDHEPEAASNNLHQALHVARRTLEPSASANSRRASRYVALREERLALCAEGPLWVDVEAFEEAAATASHASEPAALQAALDLYAGELLPEDRYEPWAEERRAELRGAYLSLLLELAGAYEERGELEAAIEALERVVGEEPSHEGAHVGLMRLYALLGRRREALGQYDRLREELFRELGAEPGAAGRRLQEEIWAGTFPPDGSPLGISSPPQEEPTGQPGRHNLPLSRTSFVGREREVLEVKRLLAMTRLLTLTGAAGCGKTRLALEVTRDLAGAYAQGAWLVELAPLSDPELVPQAVAQVLGVREQPGRPLLEILKDVVRPRKMLLVLDNCEHLIEGVVDLVDALLDSCPGLRVLATSREVLNAAGEVSWMVPSLTVPEPGQEAATIEDLEGYESVRLFVERARYRQPAFVLSSQNAHAVAEICQQLEGIPLAVELAATLVGVLSAAQIASRLKDSLKLLRGGGRSAVPRHRTLRAALEWSFDLLGEPERKLFGRLSVFAGGWTLEAAEAVGAGGGIDEDDVLQLLSRLVEKSLVLAGTEQEGALRYRMLEPVRQYAREKLEESGETEQVEERHARHYLKLAERAEPELVGAQPVAWLELLEGEYANLRAALSWALDAEEESEERAEIGLRLAAALGRFWDAHGAGEGRRWLEKGLAKRGASPTSSVRAKALNEAGFIAVYQGDPQGMALLEESLALYKELGDKSGMAFSMSNLGHAMVHLGAGQRMLSLREEAEALLSEPLDRRETAHLLQFLGFAAASELDLEQMEARLEEALALFRDLDDVRSIAMCLIALGLIPLSQGDSERAAVLFEESLLLQKELNKTAILFGLAGMAGVAALRGEPTRAATLMGACEALREAIGLSRELLSMPLYAGEAYLATAQAGLNEAAFEVAWAEGQGMTPEEAIEYALSKGEEREPPTLLPVPEQQPLAYEGAESLTRREREVALLVGRGLTNRRIASELSISERTVHGHLRNIFKKLGLGSRAGLAAWVNQRRLDLSGGG